jgi:hypothetical protein
MEQEPRTSRRRHRIVTSAPPSNPTELRDDIHIDSDANDRVRHWELPTNAHRAPSRNVLISLGFLSIIGFAGFLVWYMLRTMDPVASVPKLQTESPTGISATPRIVDALPNERPNPAAAQVSKPEVPVPKIINRLHAPDAEGKWSLAEFPTTGDRIELDASGLVAYARNFTEACVQPKAGQKIQIGVRSRDGSVPVRSFVGDGEACATVFDEPMMEVKLADGESRSIQFGLQQGAPYVAVRRIKTPSVPLQTIAR